MGESISSKNFGVTQCARSRSAAIRLRKFRSVSGAAGIRSTNGRRSLPRRMPRATVVPRRSGGRVATQAEAKGADPLGPSSQFTSMDWTSFLKHHNLVHSPPSDTLYRLRGKG